MVLHTLASLSLLLYADVNLPSEKKPAYKEWVVLSLENKLRYDEIVLEVFKQELILRQKLYER